MDADSGNCLSKFVTEELQRFLTCGILSCGFAQMHCTACGEKLGPSEAFEKGFELPMLAGLGG
jgi:hypothetical protein